MKLCVEIFRWFCKEKGSGGYSSCCGQEKHKAGGDLLRESVLLPFSIISIFSFLFFASSPRFFFSYFLFPPVTLATAGRLNLIANTTAQFSLRSSFLSRWPDRINHQISRRHLPLFILLTSFRFHFFFFVFQFRGKKKKSNNLHPFVIF